MKTRQTITHVPIEQLRAHPANIRDDLGDLTEMAASIREHGILQPLTATEDPDHDGKLLLLAGHRRLGAACLAGITKVPVIIRHGLDDPAEHLVVMLVENTQRRDLNPIERAEAYGALKARGLSMSEIARRVGTHASSVSYYLNLLLLDEEERLEVATGQRNSTDAIADIREQRQDARKRSGKPLRGRPKSPNWFGPSHRYAQAVYDTCTHRGQTPTVGGVGCGPCWESVIAAQYDIAELEEQARDLSALIAQNQTQKQATAAGGEVA